MRPAIALGLRLAFRTRGSGRTRSAMVAAASAIGVLTLLTVTGLSHADIVGSPDRYDGQYGGGRGVALVTLVVVAGVGLPVLVLAATVGRLSASMRDRRLAGLRLLGLSPARTRLVALAETGVAAAVGSLAGVPLFAAMRPVLTLVPVRGRSYPLELITPWPLAIVAIVVGVPLAVAGVASLPQRLDVGAAVRRARLADARRPGWWRVGILLAGVAWCGYFAANSGDQSSAGWVMLNLPGSLITLGIGLVVVLPVLVRLLGDLLLVVARGPAAMIAARRVQAQPAAVTRVVAGLLIGLFLITFARCVLVAFESTPQYVGARHAIEVQQQVEIQVAPKDVASMRAELAGLPGVRGVVETIRLDAEGGCGGHCAIGLVLSCADLARIAPEVTGCRDGQPLWLGRRPAADAGPLVWRADEGRAGVQLSLGGVDAGGDIRTAWLLLQQADVLIPPTAPGLAGLKPSEVTLLVLADPGRDLMAQVERIVPNVNGFDPADHDFVATLQDLVWALATLILSLGLLAYAIAAVDRAVARRREVVSLQVAGVPRGVLRKAQWLEAVIPTGVGSVFAVALGLGAGWTFSFVERPGHFPWAMGIGLAALAVIGSAAVAGLTVVAASPPIRPELIRAE